MAYYSKEEYEGKQNWANSRAEDNRNIMIKKGIAEETADLIDDLCVFRHKMHSGGNKSMFCYESADFSNMHMFINDFFVEIPGVKCPVFSTEDWECDWDIFEQLDNEGIEDIEEREEAYNTAFEQYEDNKEELNNKIEEFLSEIDLNYGTQYCPRATYRLLP